ncbi:glycosyltransferase family 4 protein [Calderihabitans maritimus]|uniref:Glycosyl transferase family protein n=1 Tax=Calderihabitans maritimus TaxID=1246530 RepID=A0A1Z5HV10_9FIRM|nr:MraY family glycosyltransferase [Calderihabitans maritimus]GAW93130.1 glycosyl transferase family protein [Calderihabitans maritimus]
MIPLSTVAAMVAAFGIALLVTPFIRKVAISMGAVDIPNERKIHKEPMPRMGGLALYLAFVIPVLLIQPLDRPLMGLVAGGSIILVLGLADDFFGISPSVKLLGQVIGALVLVFFGVQVDFLTNPFDGMIFLGKLAVPVTIFWVIGITNAVNLIDGLDGLASGTSAIAAVTVAVVAMAEGQVQVGYYALILAAAVLGFLRYNFFPAKIFMGDSGSLFLGFNLAALAVMGLTKGATIISLFVPVLILGIPILDTFFAILRRYISGRSIFQADREHLHHRLLEVGLSHRQAVLVIYALNGILGASAILLTRLTTDQGVIILIGIVMLVFLGADRLGVLRSKSPLKGSSVRTSTISRVLKKYFSG